MAEQADVWPLCTCWTQTLPDVVARRMRMAWPVLFVEHCLLHGRQVWAKRTFDCQDEAPR